MEYKRNLFWHFLAKMAHSLTVLVLEHLNKMDALSASIDIFLTLRVLFLSQLLGLSASGEKLLSQQFIPLIVSLHQLFQTSLLLNAYMVCLLITALLKSLDVLVLSCFNHISVQN